MVQTKIGNYDNEPIIAYPVQTEENSKDASMLPVLEGSAPQQLVSIDMPASSTIDEKKILKLMEQGYTRGLALSLNDSKGSFAERIWIVDNSGSMNNVDGHRVVPTLKKNDVKFVPCSRWEEIQECTRYHIQLAGNIQAQTTFRLLNNPMFLPQEVRVQSHGTTSFEESMQEALETFGRAKPAGCTPLTRHIRDIHKEVKAMLPNLRAQGKRVAIVIATDGLPTDSSGHGGPAEQNDFVESLRLLEGLPVWVVIRLCTDEDEVVEFYNDLDSCLELSIEVLDDFTAEAKEVYECNPWLNYGLPLHRMREMGFHDRVFDLLDERLLTKSELRDFMYILFGADHMDGVRDPSVNWDGFVSDVERLLKSEEPTWNPIKGRVKPWISITKLNRIYNRGRIGLFGCFP